MRSFSRRLGKVPALLLPLAVGGLASGAYAAFPDYQNQNSPVSCYDSGICTSTGIVWDNTFSSWVSGGLGVGVTNNYNEVAFDFNECYGGGMIDELAAMNLVPAAYTSASRATETAWAGSRDATTNANLPANYYSIQLTKSLIAGNTFLQAAKDGYNNTLVGPVVNKPSKGNPIENPQYTSSGPVGDSITLGKVDPLNVVANNKYLAVLFAGPTTAKNGTLFTATDDANSVAQQYNFLNGLGGGATYGNGANIYVMGRAGAGGNLTGYPAIPLNGSDSAAGLKSSWTTFVKNNATVNTQIFFSDLGHGTTDFNLAQYVKNLGGAIQNATTYTFNLVQNFVQQIQQIDFFDIHNLGITSGVDNPYFEIQSPNLINGLNVSVDGSSLASMGSPVDLYGDGSEYEYQFQLSESDINSLSTSNDSAQISWTGATPQFDFADINMGDNADTVTQLEDVPEPATMCLLGGSLVGLLIRRPMRKGSSGSCAC